MNGHIQIPREEGPMRNSADFVQIGKFHDEVANGDEADDRSIHEEEDPNDPVVDYNGQTNRGYGSHVPSEYFANNHINAGAHIQEPRAEGPMRNSVDFLYIPQEDMYISFSGSASAGITYR